MQQKELKPFDLKSLEEIRKLRENMNRGGENRSFLDELEIILESNSTKEEWKQMENDDVVLGEVWKQPIGEFCYKKRMHKFEYIYTPSQNLVIGNHGHTQKVNKGKQQDMKVIEWYIFPDGKIEMCRKDKEHSLVNNYGEPIYIISVKAMGRNSH